MTHNKTQTSKTIAVLGAGFGGMSAAYDLAKAGHKVIIYEASEGVGGLASGFKEPHWDWSVERFYHHFFTSDAALLQLVEELGLSDMVQFRRPLTVVYSKGKFRPFDSILNALLFPALGWGINKVRFGLVGLYLRLSNNWQALEKDTVDAWMRRWAGDFSYELMWEPLMIGKFGERYARQVNMAWLWARIKARSTQLGTFAGGFQAFADRFAELLRGMGVVIQFSTPIQKISTRPSGGLALETSQGRVEVDQCLVTVGPSQLAQLVPALAGDYLQGLLDLKSIGAVVMVLALKQKLSEQGYYWYNIPKKAGFPFLALVEHTNFVPVEHFGGDHIVYIGDYLETDHEHFRLTEDELLQRFLPSLQRINPNFHPDWVREAWLFRTAYAQPVPLLNHSRNIPDIQTPIPGLFFASMSQVYPWDRGTNFAVEIGRRAARRMLAG